MRQQQRIKGLIPAVWHRLTRRSFRRSSSLNRLKNGPSDYDLQAAEISLNLAQLAVEQAQAALDNATLVAPFDGVIAQNHWSKGKCHPARRWRCCWSTAANLYVDLAIDETDVVKLSEGQKVELTFDALPDAGITGTGDADRHRRQRLPGSW